MRKLHLVGLTTDQKGLIFTARRGSDSGGYVVSLDAEVLSAIAKAQGRGNGGLEGPRIRPGGEYTPGPGAQSRRRGLLTPREIQSRLRSGRSVDDVAEEADVEVEWVERFAVPILAEQAQVVELARSLVFTKPRAGGSSLPLDESVAWNLLDRGARVPDDVFDVSWSAFQLHDQVWMIRFSYRSRGRAQEARWELDVGTGELVARNKVATDLGYVEPGARLRRPLPTESEDGEGAEATAGPARAARPGARGARPSAVPSAVESTDDAVDDVEDLDDDLEEIEPAEPGEHDQDDEMADAALDEAADSDAADAAEADADGAASAGTAAVGVTTAETATAPAAEGPAAVAKSATPAGPTKARARPKAAAAKVEGAKVEGAKVEGAKARKPAATKAAPAKKAAKAPSPASTPAAPFKGLLVSTRVTKPVPTRGLLVSSPRMRGLTGGVAADTTPAPAPQAAPSPPGATDDGGSPAATASGATVKTPKTKRAGTGTGAAPESGPSRPDTPEPVSTPGGAGVRKAVAQVTSVRVAASRALVARAMLPKPTPPVVSRPTLGGRVNQPPEPENPPLPLRARAKDTPASRSGSTASPSDAGRPPLRLQPAPESPPPSPFRRSSQSEELRSGDRPAEQSRSPFVPRPEAPRVERPAGPRPATARPDPRGPAAAGTARPVSSRPESGRPESGRPETGRPGLARPEPGRPGLARPEGGRPERARPAAGRPEGGRPESAGTAPARRPGQARPDQGRPEGEQARPEQRRPNDRRADERRRSADLATGWPDDDAAGPPTDRIPAVDDRSGGRPPAGEGRPRIAAPPAGEWRPSGGRPKAPAGPPVVAPPTGIDEPRPRRRLRRPRP